MSNSLRFISWFQIQLIAHIWRYKRESLFIPLRFTPVSSLPNSISFFFYDATYLFLMLSKHHCCYFYNKQIVSKYLSNERVFGQYFSKKCVLTQQAPSQQISSWNLSNEEISNQHVYNRLMSTYDLTIKRISTQHVSKEWIFPYELLSREYQFNKWISSQHCPNKQISI